MAEAAVENIVDIPSEYHDDDLESAPRGTTWKSLGSDAIINSLKIVDRRRLIRVLASRKRREFGAALKLTDRDAHDGLVECRPYHDVNFDTKRATLEQAVQAVPVWNESYSQTPFNRPVNRGNQYTPRELSDDAITALLHDNDLIYSVNNAANKLMPSLVLNSNTNVFNDDIAKVDDDEATTFKSELSFKEYQSFTDLVHSRDKYVSCIEWMGGGKQIVAVSLIKGCDVDARIDGSNNVDWSRVLIWNFNEPIYPQHVLETPSDVRCLRFHPEKSHILIAACESGQVLYWDLNVDVGLAQKTHADLTTAAKLTSEVVQHQTDPSASKRNAPPVLYHALSPLESSHKAPASCIRWLPSDAVISNTGVIKRGVVGGDCFVSVSSDGQVLFWNINDLAKPVYSMILTKDNKPYNLTSVVMCVDSDHFIVGTEQGVMLECDSRGIVLEYPAVHNSIVSDVQLSPSDSSVWLSSGPWCFAVWKQGIIKPLLISPPTSARISSGRWSITRPAVFYISKLDGTLEGWDVLDRTHQTTLSQDVSGDSILVMEPVVIKDARGHSLHLIGLGDTTGTLRILEIPRSFIKSSKKEKKYLDTWIAREVERVNAEPMTYGYDQPSESVVPEPVVIEEDDEAVLMELIKMRNDFMKLLPTI